MEVNLKNLCQALSIQNFNEHNLLKQLKELQQIYTINRDIISHTTSSRDLVEAYTLYYLPTNYPKLEKLLQYLPEHYLDHRKQLLVYDIGSGPGTYLLAFYHWWQKNQKGNLFGEFFVLDTSSAMIEAAQKVLQYFVHHDHREQLKLNFSSKWKDDWKRSDSFKIAIFGNSLNEMKAETAIDYLEKISPDLVLIIALGTPESFREVLKVREYLQTQNDFKNIFPCPSENKSCPIKVNEGDWCHQLWRTQHGKDFERLSQLLKLKRQLMPVSAHIYVKNKIDNNKDGPSDRRYSSATLVRLYQETKFCFEVSLCMAEGDLVKARIFTRHMNKDQKKFLRKIPLGEKIVFEIIKKHQDYIDIELTND